MENSREADKIVFVEVSDLFTFKETRMNQRRNSLCMVMDTDFTLIQLMY